MVRDRNNFPRNGNGGRGGRRDFYGNNQNRSWNAGGAKSNNRSNNNAANRNRNRNRNSNSNSNSNNAYNAENGFTKFRDPQQQQRPYNDMPQRRQSNFGACRSDGMRQGGGGGGGKNWYVDGNGANSAEINVDNSGEVGQPMQQSELPQLSTTSEAVNTTATASFTGPTMPAATATPASFNPATPSADIMEDKKPLLHNIKKEKLEKIETKPPPPPSSSSSDTSSSSDSSSTEAPDVDLKPAKQRLKSMTQNTKALSSEATAKSSPKTSQKKLMAEPAAGSSSSSSSSSEEDTGRKKEQLVPAPTPAKAAKVAKKELKRKLSSEEDLVCLGKIEKKFVIEDEDETADENDVKKQQCILCDKKGHTAFQCQMICKNCTAPYHNHKNCPKPANLTVMMQSFMEFCMSQLGQYSPEQRFAYAQNLCTNGSADMANFAAVMPTSPAPSSAHSKRKRVQRKSKALPKKSSKRKRSHADDSDDETEADEQEEANTNTTTESAESETDSGLSAKVATASKTKLRPLKVSTQHDYRSSFVPHGSVPTAFTSFPSFGAAAPAYNPMLFGQMMAGTFPPLPGLNFK